MSQDAEWSYVLYGSPEEANEIAGSIINYRNVPRGATPRLNQVINHEGVIRLTLHVNDEQDRVKVPVGSLIYRNRYDDIVLVGAMIDGSWQPYPIAAAGNLTTADIGAVIKRVKNAYDKVEGFRDRHLKALVAAGHDWQNSYELSKRSRRKVEPVDTSLYVKLYDIPIKPVLANPLVGTSTAGWSIPFDQPASLQVSPTPQEASMPELQFGDLRGANPFRQYCLINNYMVLGYGDISPKYFETLPSGALNKYLHSDAIQGLLLMGGQGIVTVPRGAMVFIHENEATLLVTSHSEIPNEVGLVSHWGSEGADRTFLLHQTSEVAQIFSALLQNEEVRATHLRLRNSETRTPITVNEPVKLKMFNFKHESDPSKLAQYHKLEQKPTTHHQVLHHITEIFSKAMAVYLKENRISASDWHQDRFRATGRLGLPAIIDEFQDVTAITVLIDQNTEYTGIPKGIRVTIRLERNSNAAQSSEYITTQSFV